MDQQEQFTRLWTEAQPLIAGYINSFEPEFDRAEDLLQDVAVILLRKFPEYDPQRPFVAWAIGIARDLKTLSKKAVAAVLFVDGHVKYFNLKQHFQNTFPWPSEPTADRVWYKPKE